MEKLNIKSLADVLVIEQTSLADYLKDETTTYAIISKAAKHYADRTALTFLPFGNPLADLSSSLVPAEYTYRELFAKVNQTANLLLDLGVKKGDAVSYILPNIAENYFILLAAQAVGIANPICPMLPPQQITELLQNAESKVLITMGEHIHPELWSTILKIRHLCPQLEKIIVIAGNENPQQNIFNFHQLLAQQPEAPKFDPQLIHPEDVCSYFHTSGTTNSPKLAAANHQGTAYMAWAMGLFVGYEQNSVIISGLPMFHVGAPMVSGLVAFRQGAQVVVTSPMGWMDPQVLPNFWKIVEKYQGTSTTALPFIYKALTQIPVSGVHINSLRQAISGSAVPAYDYKAFKDQTGVKIANLWGQTEVTSISTFNPAVEPNDRHYGSMGLRLPFQQLKVVKLNANGQYVRDCNPEEAGVLCVKGPNVIGYKNPALNASAFVQPDWLNTGDWVQQEMDGYFTILGRTEDFIQHGDKIISLLELEQAAGEHPAIAEMAAISVADALHKSEVPILYSVLKPGANLTAEQFMHWLKTQSSLPAETLPAKIILTKDLPKNGMGKPLKYVLKGIFSQEVDEGIMV